MCTACKRIKDIRLLKCSHHFFEHHKLPTLISSTFYIATHMSNAYVYTPIPSTRVNVIARKNVHTCSCTNMITCRDGVRYNSTLGQSLCSRLFHIYHIIHC